MKDRSDRVIVIGGGLAGIATAYELVSRGYETMVLEARAAIAHGTSFANGGLLTPSMSDPWNSPGVGRTLLASLFDEKSTVKLRLRAVPTLTRWGFRFLRNATTQRYRAATKANFVLGRYSVELTREISQRLSFNFDSASKGTLKVFRDKYAMEKSWELATQLMPLGLRCEALETREAIALEPALAETRHRIAGALRFPDDASGDARQFCEGLTSAFIAAGGVVRTLTRVKGLAFERGSVSGVYLKSGFEPSKAVVVAAGTESPGLVHSLGLSLHIQPVKGYTVTFDASQTDCAPRVPVIDDAFHAVFVPLGARLRIAWAAEFAGNDLRIPESRMRGLCDLFRQIFPSLANQMLQSPAEVWGGLRPMSADGVPLIGPTPFPGLYINSGHGHLGWTLAASSARLVTDLIDGRAPEIDPLPYTPLR